MADDFEPLRDVLQYFADIFTESIELTATARTLTGRCMHAVFTRQVLRQRLTHRWLFYAGGRYRQRRDDQLGGTGLEFFQGELELRDLGIELFRGAAELLPAQLGDLQLQVFDQEIAILQLDIATFDLQMGGIQRRATLDDEALQLLGIIWQFGSVRHPCIILKLSSHCT